MTVNRTAAGDTLTPDADQLRQAAEAVADEYPAVAQFLLGLVDQPDAERRRAQRRSILRRMWRALYPLLTRHGAAKAIVKEWAAFEPTRVPVVPGSLRDFLTRLNDVSRPLELRQIIDDLDHTLD